MMFKPYLACDADLDKLKFPVWAMPKIDGVRAVNVNGVARARSMKPLRNKFTQGRYTDPAFNGFDGELAAEDWVHPDLCRITTSATSRIEGKPYTVWHVFDCHLPDKPNAPYRDRYLVLRQRLKAIGLPHLRLVPFEIVSSLEELLEHEARWLEMGFEGVILRDPDAPYKHGRGTMREGGYLRIKRFVVATATVVSLEEGRENANEALTNELGQTYRTTHQENMIPNGMVGRLNCVVADDVEEWGQQVLVKGQEIVVSPGAMPHSQRAQFWENQSQLVGKKITFKFFPRGIKDKPRFPTYIAVE